MQDLTEEEERAVYLYLEKRTLSEIACILDTSERSAGIILRRALRKVSDITQLAVTGVTKGYFKNASLIDFGEATERELEVIRCVVQGLTNKQIGVEIGIEEGTVRWHLNELYSRYDIHDRTSLAVAYTKYLLPR